MAILPGARPVGAEDASPAAAAENVQQMFDEIAPRYDILNHVLSAGVDRFWWWRAARSLGPVMARPDAVVLDLCCGTGDMTCALLRRRRRTGSTASTAPMLAVDFSHRMLSAGAKKFTESILPVEGDGLHLPMRENSTDLISSAFGFRNLVDYSAGLRELFRVLRPGGQIGILECNQPEGLVGTIYNLYFRKILPKVGGMLSSSAAYQYLPASVERFPRPAAMLNLIGEAGFVDARWTSYTFGIAGLYQAAKP